MCLCICLFICLFICVFLVTYFIVFIFIVIRLSLSVSIILFFIYSLKHLFIHLYACQLTSKNKYFFLYDDYVEKIYHIKYDYHPCRNKESLIVITLYNTYSYLCFHLLRIKIIDKITRTSHWKENKIPTKPKRSMSCTLGVHDSAQSSNEHALPINSFTKNKRK